MGMEETMINEFNEEERYVFKMQGASSMCFPYWDKRIWGAHMDFEFPRHPLCVRP